MNGKQSGISLPRGKICVTLHTVPLKWTPHCTSWRVDWQGAHTILLRERMEARKTERGHISLYGLSQVLKELLLKSNKPTQRKQVD
jgi:hypothetical protein